MASAAFALQYTGPFGIVVPVVFAAALASVHLFAGRLRVTRAVPRRRWLSLSSGVAVGYVFVHLLPEVQHAGTIVEETGHVLAVLDEHVYFVGLVGFVAFYGVERWVCVHGADCEADREPDRLFRVHVATFAVYNLLVGYLLLHREESGVVGLATYAVAIGLHLFVIDHGLHNRHGRSYHRYGRWTLSGAILAGFAIGAVTTVGEVLPGLLLSFLGGGVVLNVVKEELPAEHESRFWAFALGAFGYAFLLLAL